MSSLLHRAADALHLSSTIPHEAKPVRAQQKILLGITSASAQMPDHKTGLFWGELLHAYEVFTDHGYDVDVVSETGRYFIDEASVGKMASSHDDIRKWEDKLYPLHAKLANLSAAENVDIKQNKYAAIYFAGGHGCCFDLPNAMNMKRLVAAIYESGGVVGADCHGIAVFDNLQLSNGSSLLQGKQVTGFSVKGEEAMKIMDWMRQNNLKTMQEVVVGAGGVWTEHESNPMAEYVITSGRLVTGMNPASAAKVAQDMLKLIPAIDTSVDGARLGVGVDSAKPVSDTFVKPLSASGTDATNDLDKDSRAQTQYSSAQV